MDIDQFWDIIDRARAAAGPAADQAIRDFDTPDDDPNRDYWDFDDLELDRELLAGVMTGDPTALATLEATLNEEEDGDEDDEDDEASGDLEETQEIDDPIASALVAQLAQLPAAEIAAFEQIFEELRAKADRDDIANAAILIEHGFLGDESFDDFRAGLVALGRSAFDAALANPDSLAEHPVVREIAQANDPRWLGREDLLYVASSALRDGDGRGRGRLLRLRRSHSSPGVGRAAPTSPTTRVAGDRRAGDPGTIAESWPRCSTSVRCATGPAPWRSWAWQPSEESPRPSEDAAAKSGATRCDDPRAGARR